MAVARQIKIFSNFKKHSSKESKTRNDLYNLAKEYERIGEQKNPDINLKLSNENVILKHFEVKDYDEIVKNTDYSLNNPNGKYEDIYTTTPTIQATNFVNLGGVNLTFLAKKSDWVDFYKDVSSFIKDYLGDDFNTLCEVIQFDEFTPHLQLMGIFRSEVSNETLAAKDLSADPKLFEEISRKQFTRYNNKLKGTDEYTDPKNKKEYKQAKIKWVEENKAEIIKNYKPRNKKTEKKYAYVRMNNPIAMKRYSYKDYQVKLFEFCKEHEFIKNLCAKATKIRGEEVSFVMNSTEPVYDGKSKNHYEIKETIERENKEIESKIKNGEDLTENELYRYIRKKNRAILKKDFMNLDVKSWNKEFYKPQNALYDFKTKLSNDYIKAAQEVAYEPYIELKENINQLSNQKDEIQKEINTTQEEFNISNTLLEMKKKEIKEKEQEEQKLVNKINKLKNEKDSIQKLQNDFNSAKSLIKEKNMAVLQSIKFETIEQKTGLFTSEQRKVCDASVVRRLIDNNQTDIRIDSDAIERRIDKLIIQDREIKREHEEYSNLLRFLKKIPFVKTIIDKWLEVQFDEKKLKNFENNLINKYRIQNINKSKDIDDDFER